MIKTLLCLTAIASYHQLKSKLTQESKMSTAQNTNQNTTNSAKKIKTSHYDNLTIGLFELIDPYIAAVNAVPASREHESADTGHETPITQDRNLRFLLGTILSYADRQLNGPIRTKDGKTYDCAMEMMNKNNRRLTEIEREIETGKDADGRTISTSGLVRLTEEIDTRLNYKARNEAWVDILAGLIGALNTVHDEVFNELWKPVRVEAPSNFQKLDNTEKAELTKQYLAKLKAARAA